MMDWVKLVKAQAPDLELLYAIPNGGHRNKIVAAKLKKEGVKAGMPDLHLPVARQGFNSLYIEMKAQGGRVSPAQSEKIEALTQAGNAVYVCVGADAAIRTLSDYVGLSYD